MTIVRSPEAGTNARQDQREKWRSAFLYEIATIAPELLAKHIYALHYTILTIRKSFDTVVACRTQRFTAAIAADDSRVVCVIRAVHLFTVAIVYIRRSTDRFAGVRLVGLAVAKSTCTLVI